MTYRISVHSIGVFPLEHLRENAAYAVSQGIPEIVPVEPHGKPLAIVGGGPSASDHLDELRNWSGDIWAINGTCSWLASHGIKSTLFSVDPDPCLADLLDGVGEAILSSICAPEAFDLLKGRVRIFHPEHIRIDTPFTGGTTSATRVPTPAICLGYRSLHYFGCEGSFEGPTHTFKDEEPARQVLVSAGGRFYRTTLQLMNQAQSLAEIIRAYPDMLFDRSGGLLSAMLAHPETWEVAGLSKTLLDEMDPEGPRRPMEYDACPSATMPN